MCTTMSKTDPMTEVIALLEELHDIQGHLDHGLYIHAEHYRKEQTRIVRELVSIWALNWYDGPEDPTYD